MVVLGALLLAGCGGSSGDASTTTTAADGASPSSVATCLNGMAFLVTATESDLSGSSPAGINFTLKFFHDLTTASTYADQHKGTTTVALPGAFSNVVLDDSGNPPGAPGGAPSKLDSVDIQSIVDCVLQG